MLSIYNCTHMYMTIEVYSTVHVSDIIIHVFQVEYFSYIPSWSYKLGYTPRGFTHNLIQINVRFFFLFTSNNDHISTVSYK